MGLSATLEIMPDDSMTPPISSENEPAAPDTLSLHAARFGKNQPYFDVGPISQAPPTEETTPSITVAPPPAGRAKRPEPGWLTGIKAAAVFCLAFAVFFILLQAPAYYQRIHYQLTHLGKANQTRTTFTQLPILQDKPVTLSDIKTDPSQYTNSGAFAGYSLADLGDNMLLIPQISVKAPIIWGSPADETTVLANLQNGVVQYGFTALPSDGQGNVFIAGHSSYLIWDKGKYKDVFANLDRLTVGDQIAVTYKGLVYIYQMTGSKVVKPTDLSVLAQTPNPTLTLMTCVPVGTSKNRLIVSFKLVSANPTTPIELPPPSNVDPAAIFHYLSFTGVSK